MSAIPPTRAAKILDLGGGHEMTIHAASKLLPSVSRTTLYRWYKYGIDNEPAKQLLRLYAEHRVMPDRVAWRGFEFGREGNLLTRSGQSLFPTQLDQLGWMIQILMQSQQTAKDIRDALHAIAGDEDQSKRQRLRLVDEHFEP